METWWEKVDTVERFSHLIFFSVEGVRWPKLHRKRAWITNNSRTTYTKQASHITCLYCEVVTYIICTYYNTSTTCNMQHWHMFILLHLPGPEQACWRCGSCNGLLKTSSLRGWRRLSEVPSPPPLLQAGSLPPEDNTHYCQPHPEPPLLLPLIPNPSTQGHTRHVQALQYTCKPWLFIHVPCT